MKRQFYLQCHAISSDTEYFECDSNISGIFSSMEFDREHNRSFGIQVCAIGSFQFDVYSDLSPCLQTLNASFLFFFFFSRKKPARVEKLSNFFCKCVPPWSIYRVYLWKLLEYRHNVCVFLWLQKQSYYQAKFSYAHSRQARWMQK